LIPGRGEPALLGTRRYPQTWYLLDVVGREPRLLGQEVVDLSPGAIELRALAVALREHAESQERWIPFRDERTLGRMPSAYWRRLSFGPEVGYCIEHDESRVMHGGRPVRHLSLRFSSQVLTPATAAEIGLYFYGRRPAAFAYTTADEVHGFIGVEWEPISSGDLDVLLSRELE
jgi:hypothetical protein